MTVAYVTATHNNTSSTGKPDHAVMKSPIMAPGWKPHQPYGTASVASQIKLLNTRMNIVALSARQLINRRAAGYSIAEGTSAPTTKNVKYPGNPDGSGD